MIKKIINKKNILYVLFGILTTFINMIVFIIFNNIFGFFFYLISNSIAFLVATIFAFLTNKHFVFSSKNWKLIVVLKEGVSFIFSRLLTFLLIEQFGLIIFIEIFHIFNYFIFGIEFVFIIKLILSFISVILNYLISELIIFKKKENI